MNLFLIPISYSVIRNLKLSVSLHSAWGGKFVKPEHFDTAYNPIKESLINQAKGKVASSTEELAENTILKAAEKQGFLKDAMDKIADKYSA